MRSHFKLGGFPIYYSAFQPQPHSTTATEDVLNAILLAPVFCSPISVKEKEKKRNQTIVSTRDHFCIWLFQIT